MFCWKVTLASRTPSDKYFWFGFFKMATGVLLKAGVPLTHPLYLVCYSWSVRLTCLNVANRDCSWLIMLPLLAHLTHLLMKLQTGLVNGGDCNWVFLRYVYIWGFVWNLGPSNCVCLYYLTSGMELTLYRQCNYDRHDYHYQSSPGLLNLHGT